jgi:glycosyltransferase involved in cell wall biosynthesis
MTSAVAIDDRAGAGSVPPLSVCMVTNRFDAYFEQAAASILDQDFADFEFVIVANGMSDDVFTELSAHLRDPRVRLFRTHVSGICFSRNLALAHARGEFVAVMDADDVAEPARLGTQIAFMRAHPDVGVCGSAYRLIDSEGKARETIVLPQDHETIAGSFWRRNALCHPATVLRRELVARAGGYSGYSAEDYELWLRLQENPAVRFHNLPDVLLGYRVPVVSLERYSRQAYRHVAAARLRQFLRTGHPKWLAGVLLATASLLLRARRA